MIKKLLFIIFFATSSIQAYETAICSLFYNEARFLKEWIEFHKIIGIEHFYLYDLDSQDNYLEILEPYMEEGVVELFHSTLESNWEATYTKVHNDCLKIAKTDVKWLIFIDVDEYLLPLEENSLSDLLDDSSGAIPLKSQVYGTSGISSIPDNILLIEAFLLRGDFSTTKKKYYKHIVQPKSVKKISSDYKLEMNKPYTVSKPSEKMRINHYWFRDETFFFTHFFTNKNYNENQKKFIFDLHSDFNSVVDTSMLRYAMPLRDKIYE